MSIYIIQGCYTTEAAKGMMAKPADRAEAVRPLIEGAGGKMLSYYTTLGAFDFQITVETDDTESLMGALIVAGATGTVGGMQTVQAFLPAEFTAAQQKAGKMASGFKPANA